MKPVKKCSKTTEEKVAQLRKELDILKKSLKDNDLLSRVEKLENEQL